MPSFGVTEKKERDLRKRMSACGVAETDLEEKFIRSGGPGGQHVNRTATCVYLKHAPTGHEVKMQQARSQALNRYYARKRLCELLEADDPTQQSPEEKKREKLRKQKARRKRRTKKKDTETGGEAADS